MAEVRVEDPNYFWCLLCDAQANSNMEKVRAGAYGVQTDADGHSRFIGICAFCKGLNMAHVRRKTRADHIALEMRELADLALRFRRRGLSADEARMRAVTQQVRCEDYHRVEFMEWLHKNGRF